MLYRYQNRLKSEYPMKPGIHPEYREVLFHDTAANHYFVIGSTVKTSQTSEYKEKTYPYITLDVSSASHPFYTGKQRIVDTGGRVDRFNKRFGALSSKK